jgi:hypothetical protein
VSAPSKIDLVLPPALISRADLARLVREIEDIDNDLEAQKARNHATGKTGYSLPPLSHTMNDFVELNKVDVADDQARMKLKEQMKVMKDHAPVMHMTFAVEADPASLQQLTAYLRKEIHPQALLVVGMQPALVGGAYVRTPNHIHDFSVRSRMAEKRGLILQAINQLSNVIAVVEAPPEIPLDENGAPLPKAATPTKPAPEKAKPAAAKPAETAEKA